LITKEQRDLKYPTKLSWGKKGTLKSQFPWVITHLPWQTHNSPRIEAQKLVAQGTWEIEIFNQVTPRKKGFESSNQGALIKG
jgi:hypothetical protein